jgi:hypothetical protein
MSTSITVTPAEKGTAKVTAGPFLDEDTPANEVTPSSITWKLTDRNGNVINSRTAVSVTPAATVEFALTGNDLALSGDDTGRVLLISWEYDSSLGSDLVGREQAHFSIEAMVGVT